MAVFYYILSRLVTVLLCIWYDVRFEGAGNVPRQGGYLLVCNHRSFLEPVLLTWKVPSHICYFAKTELYDHPFLGIIVRVAGTIRIQRGAGDTGALDRAGALLKKGKVVGVFPEGTRSRDGSLQRAKSGVAVMAKMTGADILPCCVLMDKPLRFRSPITIRYGKMIANSELGLTGQSLRETAAAGKIIMARIAALMEGQAGESLD
jgi:1-acyl-sn-glycerol-3-phosphate acyltransferase